jgi:hypothetical protein
MTDYIKFNQRSARKRTIAPISASLPVMRAAAGRATA